MRNPWPSRLARDCPLPGKPKLTPGVPVTWMARRVPSSEHLRVQLANSSIASWYSSRSVSGGSASSSISAARSMIGGQESVCYDPTIEPTRSRFPLGSRSMNSRIP